MLNRFRTKQTTALSAYLIILSLMVKMMMPVAHASTAVTGEKTGFFAALCTANGVVLVDTNNIGADDNPPTKSTTNNQQVDSTNLCPLCLLLEQGLYDSTVLHDDTALRFALHHSTSSTLEQSFTHAFQAKQRPIRAPPVIS